MIVQLHRLIICSTSLQSSSHNTVVAYSDHVAPRSWSPLVLGKVPCPPYIDIIGHGVISLQSTVDSANMCIRHLVLISGSKTSQLNRIKLLLTETNRSQRRNHLILRSMPYAPHLLFKVVEPLSLIDTMNMLLSGQYCSVEL